MANRTWGRAAVAAVLGAVVVAASGSAAQAQNGWVTSVKDAQALARRSNKIILANFTGSDWCPYCVKLRKEVFDTPEFAKWAAANAILLELDYPRTKAQPAAIKEQNKQLAEQFGITGYPTVLFLDVEGKVIGKYGYNEGGAEKWIQVADQMLANRPKPPKPEELKTRATLTEAQAAAKAEGKPLLLLASDPKKVEQAKALETLLKAQDFVKPANRRAVAVNLTLPLDAESEDGKALAALWEGIKLPRGPVVALVDVGANKLLYQTMAPPKAEVVVPALKKALPPIKYDGSWLEDFETAQAIAADLKRPMLLDFTGSDWCGLCMKLDAEVFGTEAFKKAAADGLVLVKLDFPKRKKLSPEVQQQNEGLQATYGVSGYPTIIILSSTGQKLGQMGYMEGGPDAFLPALRKFLTAKPNGK